MLVLTRKENESLIINENIEITVLGIDGDQIKLGIKAPKEIPILRKEIVIKTENENFSALNTNMNLEKFFKENR
ncbi:carbon storage regulator CsrA [Mesobacillus jeotgali]|uniref:carbon storage regulator CsrA n=1 Tax=Mesobacillus jeotgali TaxID=129985 RepID=UPI001CFE7982|nr:carbon storage regulator CsrA [Mesobacillus jeotgali]